MKTERVKNSVYNGLSNLIINISVTILSFIVRTIFIRFLGEQCLGLDGLFTNILSLLSLADLGFSTAISFSLYEPLAKHDKAKISQLMSYFKKVYMYVAMVILVVGLCLLPFMKYIVKDYTISYNIYIIYILYLINTVSSYFTSYSSILIEADQKNYKLTKIRLVFNFLTYGIQLIILFATKNFILYLIIQFVFRFIERLITNWFIKKNYKDIDFYSKSQLPTDEKNVIKKNIKGILFHKVGDYAVNGTDNILISSIVNISTTGIYSNYLSIISILRNLIGSIISATTSSLGNLNVLESNQTKKNVFNLINFICYFMSGCVVVCLYFCLNPFIKIWVGDYYLLDNICRIVICINFYLNCIMLPITAVKSSAGLYYVDRYVPIIQAIINLTVSIIFGFKFGLIGILIGTTISCITTVNITKPYIIFKYVFKTSCFEYFIGLIKNIIVIVVSIIISYFIILYLPINNDILKFIINGLICLIIYSFVFVLSYFRSYEFKYFYDRLVNRRKD